MTPERWLPVIGYEDRYEISDSGVVRSAYASTGGPAGHILKPGRATGGYPSLSLRASDGTKRTYVLHRLVLTTFVGPRPRGFCCRHLDGDPNNNHLTNIVWGTYAENAADRERHGKTARGARAGSSKPSRSARSSRLTTHDVDEIRRRVGAGETQTAVAALYDLNQATVSYMVNRHSWAWHQTEETA